jgi:hypothetical protein
MEDLNMNTPPRELVQQWENEALELWVASDAPTATHIAARAAQWGADQELEACLRLVEIDAGEDAYDFARYIRAARRPKSPSLKERALNALSHLIDGAAHSMETTEPAEYVRRALERLPDD